jgi:hypothetical protein
MVSGRWVGKHEEHEGEEKIFAVICPRAMIEWIYVNTNILTAYFPFFSSSSFEREQHLCKGN